MNNFLFFSNTVIGGYMMNEFKEGDIAWAMTNNGWVQVKILRRLGTYYQVKKLNENAAFGVSSHRLLSESEYNENIKPTINTSFRPPDLH